MPKNVTCVIGVGSVNIKSYVLSTSSFSTMRLVPRSLPGPTRLLSSSTFSMALKHVFLVRLEVLRSIGLGLLILFADRPLPVAHCRRDVATCPGAFSSWHAGRLDAMRLG